MAEGVIKTYRKNYYNNFAKSAEMMGYNRDLIKDKLKELLTEKDIYPTMAYNHEYLKREAKQLEDVILYNDYLRVREFATKYALEETDRDTYQAMEALVHNLNTMHSRAGKMCARIS